MTDAGNSILEDTTSDMYRALARDYAGGQVVTSSLCNCNCFFCSTKCCPPHVPKNLNRFLGIDEIDHLLHLVQVPGVVLGTSSSVNSCEFFAHPEADAITDLLFGKWRFERACFFTNGTGLTEDRIRRMQHIDAHVSFSVNDVDPAVRMAMMGGSLASHERALDSIDMLEKYEVPYDLWIMPTKTRLENGMLEHSFRSLAHLGRTFRLHKPGYTKYTPEDVVAEMDIADEELLTFALAMRDKYQIHVLYEDLAVEDISSLDRAVRVSLQACRESLSDVSILADPSTSKLLLCSEAVESVLRDVFRDVANAEIKAVRNRTFGGNVRCSGLLLVDDYVAAIDEFLAEDNDVPDAVLLPKESFSPFDMTDLALQHVGEIGERFGIQVALL